LHWLFFQLLSGAEPGTFVKARSNKKHKRKLLIVVAEMKIALVNPGKSGTSTAMPMGLGYLAAVIRERGHDVVVKDMEVEPEGLEEFLLKENPDMIGITISTPLFPLAKNIIKKIKTVLPETTLLVGGSHVTAVKEEMLKIPEVDIAVYGEGEITFLEILESKPLEKILGIVYREGNSVITNPSRPFIQNLDKLPFPAWDLFPLSKYKIHPPYGKSKKFMNMITSRGCPYRCAYCSKVWGHSFRGMSPERVFKEIKHLYDNYGIREFRFYDDDFTMDMKRAEKICDLITESDIKISWSCTTRVNLVNKRLLEKMKKSGCFLISYGIESGSQEILDTIRKGYTIDQVRNAFRWTKEVGIRILGYVILGLPGETEETISDSIKLIKEINPDFCSWGILSIYPNTDIKKMFEERNAKFYPYTNWGTFSVVKSSDEYNEHILFAEENLSREFLENKLKEINRMFYLTPERVINELLKIRSFREFTRTVNTGLKLVFKGR
jgi:anaerobic magnesium-protoporphyrin IX monomethyl ester cyclase